MKGFSIDVTDPTKAMHFILLYDPDYLRRTSYVSLMPSKETGINEDIAHKEQTH